MGPNAGGQLLPEAGANAGGSQLHALVRQTSDRTTAPCCS